MTRQTAKKRAQHDPAKAQRIVLNSSADERAARLPIDQKTTGECDGPRVCLAHFALNSLQQHPVVNESNSNWTLARALHSVWWRLFSNTAGEITKAI